MEHLGHPRALAARIIGGRICATVRGFTLIELLVVLAIISIISMIALTSQSSFNKSLVLANAAYDVALTLRSAQTYGMGSRAAGTSANAGYGLHFDISTPNTFIFFADTYPSPSTSSTCHPTADASAPTAQPGNCAYDASQGEAVITYKLGNGITISDFCSQIGGAWYCATTHSSLMSTLDVLFARPNPEPFISSNGLYSPSTVVTKTCIAFTSPSGGARYISVGASGVIVANATSCP